MLTGASDQNPDPILVHLLLLYTFQYEGHVQPKKIMSHGKVA